MPVDPSTVETQVSEPMEIYSHQEQQAPAQEQIAAATKQQTAPEKQTAATEQETAARKQTAAAEQETAAQTQTATAEQQTAAHEQTAAAEQQTAAHEQTAAEEQQTAAHEQTAAAEQQTAAHEQTAAAEQQTAAHEQESAGHQQAPTGKHATQDTARVLSMSSTNKSEHEHEHIPRPPATPQQQCVVNLAESPAEHAREQEASEPLNAGDQKCTNSSPLQTEGDSEEDVFDKKSVDMTRLEQQAWKDKARAEQPKRGRGGRGRGRGRGGKQQVCKRPACKKQAKEATEEENEADLPSRKRKSPKQKEEPVALPAEEAGKKPAKAKAKASASKPNGKAAAPAAAETRPPKAKAAKKQKTTFARRYLPATTEGAAKWQGLKQAYESDVAQKLRTPSKYEERRCLMYNEAPRC